MSEKFYQYYFPCVECIVRPICKDKRQMMEDVKVNGSVPSLGVPIWDFNVKSYHKGLIECTINILKDIMNKVSRTEPEDRKDYELDNLPMEYVHLLIDMADLTCHMINSTSWREGELQNFDRFELKSRVDKLGYWLKKRKH